MFGHGFFGAGFYGPGFFGPASGAPPSGGSAAADEGHLGELSSYPTATIQLGGT